MRSHGDPVLDRVRGSCQIGSLRFAGPYGRATDLPARRATTTLSEPSTMTAWLRAALDHIPNWLEHRMRVSEQPGCSLAIAHRGQVVVDRAFGSADLAAGIALTPLHRVRVASHSKTFTAAGILRLRLREQGRLYLDDRIGRYVTGLHPDVANASLSQLLSHSAGLVRDGSESGQWTDRRPSGTKPASAPIWRAV